MAIIIFVVIAAWLGMGYRLFEIQVVRADELAEKGLSQRLVTRDMPPSGERSTIAQAISWR